jgi:hypothetical protein
MIVQLQFLPRDDEHILPPVRPQQSRSLPKPIASLPSFFILLLSEVLIIVPHIPLSSLSTTPECSQCESVHSSGFHNRQFAAKTSAPANCGLNRRILTSEVQDCDIAHTSDHLQKTELTAQLQCQFSEASAHHTRIRASKTIDINNA